MALCTQKAWEFQNASNYAWYYNNYPELIYSGVRLPINNEALQLFYIKDMNERNLSPLSEYLNCYQYLFEYFIGRLTNVITHRGKTWLENTWQNLPGAFNKTIKQITNPLGIPITTWLLIGVAGLIIIKKL